MGGATDRRCGPGGGLAACRRCGCRSILLPDFDRLKKQTLEKADRAAKIKAAKEEHDAKRYSNRCGGDYADDGVRVVDSGVEYEMMA